jgi:hypothetical protein
MAGFTADLNPKSNAMSLGDMMKMGLYSAETAIANRKAQVAEEQAKETPVVMQFMKNQEGYMTNGRIDLDKASILPVIAPLTGMDQYQKLVQLHKYRTEADDAEMGLDTKQRGIVASVGETLGYAGVQDPKQYVQAYQGLKQLYPNNMNIAKLADSYSNMISTMPPGEHVAKAAIKNSVDLLNPQTKNEMMAPKAGTTTIGGATVGTVTQPSILGGQPSVSTAPLGGGQPSTGMQPTSQIAPKSKVLPDLIKEDPDFNYVGPANPLNLNDLQKESYTKGKAMLREAPINATAAEEGKQYVRKVEEVAFKASGAGAYKTAQDWARLIVAQPDLDTLRKNIAGVMVQNANTMGLNKTDSSRGDAATISGSDAISPEALRDIMQRADAQFTATTKFAQGLKNYREKRGEVNSALNADRFQSAWASNYDSRIFQLQNIRDSNYPEAVKKQRYEALTKSMSDKEFDELDKKAKAIDRLVEGSYK